MRLPLNSFWQLMLVVGSFQCFTSILGSQSTLKPLMFNPSMANLMVIGSVLVPMGVLMSIPAIASAKPSLVRPSIPVFPAVPSRSSAPIPIAPPVRPSLPIRQNLSSGLQPQILLNNQVHNLPWIQWQTEKGLRIGVPDGTIRQLFGVDFLSTDDATQQPIAWFSDDRSTALLPVKFVSPDRYLDITDWAKSLGWQLKPQAQQLTITTPTSNLTQLIQVVPEIQRGKQKQVPLIPTEISPVLELPGTDRIVLELDRPTLFQVDPRSQDWTLRLNSQVNPATLALFKPKPSQKIASLSFQSEGTQSILKLGIPLTTRPVVTTLSNPPRIVIDVGVASPRTQSILWQPGMKWQQQLLTIGNQSFTVISFEISPKSPGLMLRPILPNSVELAGISPLIKTAQQSKSVLAMNGGFFNRINQLPLGLIQMDGQVKSGPILNRGVMAWDRAGTFEFDRYSLQETATIGKQSFPLTHLNSAYIQAGIARYTPAWGNSYSTLSDNEIVMEVVADRITTQTPVPTAGTSISIPPNGYLLTFRSNKTAAATVAPRSTVSLAIVPSNPRIAAFPYALGGGPLLIKDRQVVLDAAAEKFSPAFIRERAARSAVGRTNTGNLLMVVVHPAIGRGGATLLDMAQIMQQLGAIDALNFDGGSSTTLHLGGLGGQILDRPSRSSARVHNAIGIFKE
ncbi:MAG: phosphodiester glycosidase family protein [Alkalinema sp. CAN_BIN05]|nr:phosphodiester glycosidase family protein [Alkalinema sp. CAN_BIN05]